MISLTKSGHTMNSATQETLKEARAQWIAGDHAAGGKLFVEAMDAEPLDPAIDIALADTALLSSDFKVAENAYGSAIEKSPDTIDLYSRHAAVLISLGEFDKARTSAEWPGIFRSHTHTHRDHIRSAHRYT